MGNDLSEHKRKLAKLAALHGLEIDVHQSFDKDGLGASLSFSLKGGGVPEEEHELVRSLERSLGKNYVSTEPFQQSVESDSALRVHIALGLVEGDVDEKLDTAISQRIHKIVLENYDVITPADKLDIVDLLTPHAAVERNRRDKLLKQSTRTPGG